MVLNMHTNNHVSMVASGMVDSEWLKSVQESQAALELTQRPISDSSI